MPGTTVRSIVTSQPLAQGASIMSNLLLGQQALSSFERGIVAIACAALIAGLSACASSPQQPTNYADRVVVKKGERKLTLYQGSQVLREYRINLGDSPVGHKFHEGDERTPLGDYILDWRNPNSQFHKSIHVSYPNEGDKAFARAMGYPSPGGMIMIHGRPNWLTSERLAKEYDSRDWTDGCIAVQNHEMDEIWRLVRDGTPIRILP
jgi:murein L,D-transpeptidase YafK